MMFISNSENAFHHGFLHEHNLISKEKSAQFEKLAITNKYTILIQTTWNLVKMITWSKYLGQVSKNWGSFASGQFLKVCWVFS